MADPTMRLCNHCGEWKHIRGIGHHEKACAKKNADKVKSALFAQQLRRRESRTRRTFAPSCRSVLLFVIYPKTLNFNIADYGEPQPLGEQESLHDNPVDPNLDDIRYEFHPHSGLAPENCSLDEYLRQESSRRQLPSTDQKPWSPFRTRLDFEVAEFAQENLLNSAAINQLITLIRRCAANVEEFTVQNHTDMNKQWEAASKKCTDFKKYTVTVPYKNTQPSFDMYARPLWDWTLDLIRDPCLANCFVWDAVKMYRHNGTSFMRFWNEPWTADAFWQIQSLLPDNKFAKLCPYIIYADKSKLSSFGTQKAYPIIARLANIVVGIRNGNEWGGGQIVGELPVIKDDTAESGKTGYVNFKNAVWHSAFYKLLESIAAHSKTGIWTECGDGEKRWLFPVVLILAADYEEASVMALIRGLGGNHPCPICLVKRDGQADLTIISKLRTADESKKAVTMARTLSSEAGETLLKDLGLRKVNNVFWNVAHSDPHHAISFDRLHSHHSGLWGDHLFGQIKDHLTQLGERSAAKLDQQFDKLPRWRNLNHFQTVTNISFNDGSKHEDIAKMMIFASHNILTDKLGLILLECFRSYLELDVYLGLEIHTTETIAAGRRQLQKFDQRLKKNQEACVGTEFEKNWNFPKAHLHQHAFDDIERKGVTKNFSTKIDESMHGPVRAAYLQQTNFKNVQPQILRSLHRRMVARYIRDQLEDLEEFVDDEDPERELPSDLEELGNVVVGAKRKSESFLALETKMKDDTAFNRFRIRFAEFVNVFLPAFGHALPGGKRIVFNPDQEITPYQFLKVLFKSLDNWLDNADFLCCNPSFHNRERYDAAIVKTTSGNVFVRLVYVFTCMIGERVHPFALVQALDVGTGQRSAKDKALRLYHVRERQRKECEFISVHSIIRGALLAPDFAKRGDYLVVDVVDSDMFFRLKAMYPGYASE
ncbi:hypothetical protein DFH07DRAFT_900870 [Mycena maculata]|uniref:Uncharacterized protein n=1 Tax=Mycena maculata TaxID=230809 RepID=A0AAD7KDF0_9AGAR|nr:hypothetical protein DFH07DRAFT_900870 [Mycena maculata]